MFEVTGVAVAAVMIPEEKLIRVLVVDDEDDFQQDMKDYFADYGYAVDMARNPDQAKVLLEKNKYQIVLYDVNFKGLELKGDTFVLNYKNFKDARVVVVTGLEINQLRHSAALKNLEIPVWGKGDLDWGTNLTGLTEATAQSRKQEIVEDLNEFMRDKLGVSGNYIVTGSAAAATATAMAKAAPAPEPWELAVEDILIGWLQSQHDQERPFFLVGRRVFSANKMVEQVRQKTEVGKELLGMFVTEIKHSLGLNNKPNALGDK